MPVDFIEDSADPRLADYRRVSEAELIKARGLFFAEGRLIVRRLLADRRYVVRSLLLSTSAYQDLGDILSLSREDVPVYVCRTQQFLPVTGLNLHRGCLALAERRPDVSCLDLLPGIRRVVVLEGVANADNVGGVFRNAAAFGAEAVLLSPSTCDRLYRKAIRTSMGATLQIPFARATPWPTVLEDIRRLGFLVVAFTPQSGATLLDDFATVARSRPLACLFGAEGDGLSEDAARLADVRVRIPIKPTVDSLNLAVAAGIVLSRLTPPDDLE